MKNISQAPRQGGAKPCRAKFELSQPEIWRFIDAFDRMDRAGRSAEIALKLSSSLIPSGPAAGNSVVAANMAECVQHTIQELRVAVNELYERVNQIAPEIDEKWHGLPIKHMSEVEKFAKPARAVNRPTGKGAK